MGRSQETFGKKEVRNKREKKRKEKEKKRALKKSEGKKSNFDDMIAYVDEFGMITSSPPDPNSKQEIDAESIELDITKNRRETESDLFRKGIVTYFNDSKGYGFIRDLESNQRIFVHITNLVDAVEENSVVVFEIGKGVKGTTAMNVRLFKE
jgi:cold shock CspA family protein